MSIPILFLHGWAMDGAIFQNVANLLGGGFDCHAPDLPGHGVNPTDAPSIDACVDLARRGIAELDRPLLVGWSMGAAVAWEYISRFGTAGLRGLVTIDMSPRMLPDADWNLGLRGQTKEEILATSTKIEPHWHRMVNSITRNMYSAEAQRSHEDEVMRRFLRSQNPKRLRPLWDDLTVLDARQTIATIDIPYLVCSGAKSRLYSADVGRWIAQNAPNAHAEVFQNSGHSPHLEEPEVFCETLRRFVSLDCAPT